MVVATKSRAKAKSDAAPARFTPHTTPLPTKDSAAGKSPPTSSPAQRASKMPNLSGMAAQLQKDLEEEAVAKERHAPNVNHITRNHVLW